MGCAVQNLFAKATRGYNTEEPGGQLQKSHPVEEADQYKHIPEPIGIRYQTSPPSTVYALQLLLWEVGAARMVSHCCIV